MSVPKNILEGVIMTEESQLAPVFVPHPFSYQIVGIFQILRNLNIIFPYSVNTCNIYSFAHETI